MASESGIDINDLNLEQHREHLECLEEIVRADSEGLESFVHDGAGAKSDNSPKIKLEDLADIDNSEAENGEDEFEPLGNSSPMRALNYSILPPACERVAYQHPIYCGSTYNPAVFQAIIRIAEINLPFINWDFVMNYIPNLSAAEPIPALRKSTFPEDHPHTPRRGDELVNVGFLPSLYQDGRHGIGYFTFHMGRTPMESRWRICLFTPCSNKDLEHFSMIENLQPGETGGGPMNWKSIAVRSGRWANKNDGFGINWSVGFITAVYLWKKRLGITMGVKEWVPTAT